MSGTDTKGNQAMNPPSRQARPTTIWADGILIQDARVKALYPSGKAAYLTVLPDGTERDMTAVAHDVLADLIERERPAKGQRVMLRGTIERDRTGCAHIVVTHIALHVLAGDERP